MKLQIHHIEMCVSDPIRTLKILKDQFGFALVGTRSTALCEQIVVQAGKKIFIITRRNDDDPDLATDKPESEPWTIFCCKKKTQHDPHIDSVFNIAIQVENLSSVLAHLENVGCTVLRNVDTVSSLEGTVKYAIVKSCCGNIVHTLIEKTDYHGQFLPGFKNVGKMNVDANQNEFEKCPLGVTSHFDHVSLACRAGETNELIDWYSRAFGMRRFITNRDDSIDEGLVIGGEVGMRLKVMEFWACSEKGITSANTTNSCSPSHPNDWEPLKIVIVESLPNTTNTQIDIFIRDHGGPGVQHIGLYSPNILETVARMTSRGVKFRRPPPAYYTEIGQLKAILAVGEDLEKLQECGILLDSEADALDDSTDDKYLMQIFTYPMFDRETFFLEVIQRKGALGFGVGNVTALARSINYYNITQNRT